MGSNFRVTKLGLMLGLSTAALIASAPARAQAVESNKGGLEEIVVTAQKRSENLQNVPIAVTAVTSAALAKSGVTNLTGLTVAVPGLNMTNTFGRLTSSLRGIGSTSVGAGVENPVALYIDGVYYASTTASLLSLNNISQIEVLKGPQGTLFGRNATAGLMQVFTKDPTREFHADFQATYANYNTLIGSAYLAGGLTDTISADIAVYAKHQGDGWGRNVTLGRDVYDVPHDVSVRSKIVFRPGDDTKLTLIGDYANIKDNMNPGSIRVGSISPFQPGIRQPDTGYDVPDDYQQAHTIKAGGVSLKLDQGIGELNLVSITAYRQSKSFVAGDIDGLSNDLGFFYLRQPDSQFTQELQLSSASTGKLKWTVGAFYFKGSGAHDPLVIPLRFAGISVVLPKSKQNIESLAGYAQGTYAIGSDTNITLGLRYTGESHRLVDTSSAIIGRDDPVSSASASAIAINPPAKKDGEFTYRASIDHRFSDSLLAYASYNRGFKAGGFSVSSPTTPAYDPETLDAYEIGMKTDLFDRRVRFNAAGFYYVYKGVQVQQYVPPAVIETRNGARAESYGVDADLTAILAPGLQFSAGATYSRATFTSFPGCARAAADGGVPLAPGDCSGFNLPIAPRFTASAALDYTLDTAMGSFNLNGNAYYNSGYVLDVANAIRQRDYLKLGIVAGWTNPDKTISVKIYGQNLTNKRVITYGDSQAVGTMLVLYDAPRTYGLTVGYRF